MKIQLGHKFDEIISLNNLCLAWGEFIQGKRGKIDVQEFGRNLADNIVQLQNDLADGSYRHGGYYAFRLADPKPREIHKASVRDRLVHHAVYRVLYPFFDRTFIADSFSCRDNKGMHRALARFDAFARTVSKNHRQTCWVLKCDIRKFFASIDQRILMDILREHIVEERLLKLLEHIIISFNTRPGIGLPLGNLTSQLFTNIYMNVFDQFMKHELKAKFYIRYADDFVIFSENHLLLEELLPRMESFFISSLGLHIHPDKIYLQTVASGVDYLGWVNFPHHRVLRASTRRRMMRRVYANPRNETFASYCGMLSHGNSQQLRMKLDSLAWLLRNV